LIETPQGNKGLGRRDSDLPVVIVDRHGSERGGNALVARLNVAKSFGRGSSAVGVMVLTVLQQFFCVGGLFHGRRSCGCYSLTAE
jgi:hypothetical protein